MLPLATILAILVLSNTNVLSLATILAIVVLTILELRPVVLAHLSVQLRMITCSVQTSYLSFFYTTAI